MPESYVHAVEGRGLDQRRAPLRDITKRAPLRDITAAAVKHVDVPADAAMLEIVEASKENKAKGGVLFSER
ncbi:MAG TPA: 4-oxalocrotonate tautomerase [Rhodopila sp.]